MIKNLNNLTYNNKITYGIQYIKGRKFKESENYFKEAIKIDSIRSEAYINLSNLYILDNKKTKALKILKEYLIKNSFNDTIANHLGKICINYNFKYEFFELLELVNITKNKISKDRYYLYFIYGKFLQKNKNFLSAVNAYKNSIKCKEDYFEPYFRIFYLLETTNDLINLEKYIKIAINIFCGKKEIYIINFYRAILYNRNKNFRLSEEIIRDNNLETHLNFNTNLFIRLHDLMSKNNEKLNKFSKSFYNIEKRNQLMFNLEENKKYNRNDIINTMKQYKSFFTFEKYNKIKRISENIKIEREVVFLVGFPRSGTTLLDTILRTHSKITVLEEKPYLLEARHDFFLKHNNDLNALLDISEFEIVKIRDNYFNKFRKQISDQENIIIDKLPLSIIEIGFIKSIFPNSKFILALRHPCDVVLSCYFSFFSINEAMINFLNWEDTIDFYNKVFNLFEHYENELKFDYFSIKYEDLIADFEKNITQLLSFIGLKYENNLKNFNLTAKKRDKISTPSYSQVINPLYSTSIGRWKNFSKNKNAEADLIKWIDKFSY